MKVLLISSNTLKVPYPVYPLGLDHVAGAVTDQHDVRIEDLNALDDMEMLAPAIRSFEPDVVGVSLRNIDNTDQTDQQSFVSEYRRLGQLIRRTTRATLVLGGTGFTLFPRELMDVLGADYGILGEGERLLGLLEALERNRPVADIPGLITPKDISKTPQPIDVPFGRKELRERPHLQYYLKKGGMLNLQTKRGCPFRCIYCTYPHIEGRKLRFLSPQKVAEEALQIQAAGAKYFFITDAVFNADTDHSTAVAKAFIKAGVKIPWGAFFAPQAPPLRYFDLMSRAGLTHAEFGTESMCDSILKNYGKPFRKEGVLKAHKAALDAGLYASHFLLLGGPGEHADSIDETLDGIERLKQSVFFFFALCASIRIRICMTGRWPKDKSGPIPGCLSPASMFRGRSGRMKSLRGSRIALKTASTGSSVPAVKPQPPL